MSSPFEVFRRNQIMTVVLIGLAMLSFIIFGAISDPRAIPAPLWILAFASVVGGVAWMAGLKKKKQNDWGITGMLAGVVFGVAFMFMSRPPADIEIDGGSLTSDELFDKQRELGMANSFLQLVYEASAGEGQRLPQSYALGFGNGRNETESRRYAIDWELLGREADRLGIDVSNEAVNEFLSDMTGGRLRREHITEARQRLRVPEPELYRILRDGIAARTAFLTLFQSPELPPEQYYDFYQRLNESRDLQLVSVPVDAFTGDVGEPSEDELLQLFSRHRAEFPNFTRAGEFVAGKPGFYQPVQNQVAYVEFPFEALKKTVEQPTEEEIQAEYDRRYNREVPAAPPLPEAPPAPDSTTPDAAADGPADSGPGAEMKAEEKPAASADEEKPEAPSTQGTEEKPATGTPPAKPEPVEPSEETSFIPSTTELMPVALIQEEAAGGSADEKPVAEPTATEEPAAAPAKAEKPAEAKPAEEEMKAPEASEASGSEASDPGDPESKPAEEKMASPKPDAANGEGDAASSDASTPETNTETAEMAEAEGSDAAEEAASEEKPPTLEEAREELLDDLVSARAREKQRQLIERGQIKLSTLAASLALDESDTEGLTRDEINSQMAEWAKENGGVFAVTPMMTTEELLESEDHPVGKANTGQGNVATAAARTPVTATLVPLQAFDFDTQSFFLWWKTDAIPPQAPESMDDPRVRKMVVEAWKMQQAYPKAEARAEEIAEIVRAAESADAVKEKLSEVTITGDSESDYATVKSTGPFTWMSTGRGTQTNPFAASTPEVTDVASRLKLEKRLGGDLLEMAFRELKPGEVGISPNIDKSTVFVVSVKPRDGENEIPSEFLNAPLFTNPYLSPYPNLAQSEQRKFRPNLVVELERKYGIDSSMFEL